MPVSRRNLIVIPAFGLAQLAGCRKYRVDNGDTPLAPGRGPKEAVLTVEYQKEGDCWKRLTIEDLHYRPKDFNGKIHFDINDVLRIKGWPGTHYTLVLTSADHDLDAPKCTLSKPADPGPEWENPLVDGRSKGLVGALKVKMAPSKSFHFKLGPLEASGCVLAGDVHTSWHLDC